VRKLTPVASSSATATPAISIASTRNVTRNTPTSGTSAKLKPKRARIAPTTVCCVTVEKRLAISTRRTRQMPRNTATVPPSSALLHTHALSIGASPIP
jgi:hypothetical protein